MGRVPDSVHLPLNVLRAGRDVELQTGRPIVVACTRGPRAELAASVLTRTGFSDVGRLDGRIAEVPSFRRGTALRAA